MSLWYLVLLALLQGLTEYLPVSSSAHLILLPRVLDVPDQGLVFDVAANTGTFLAVVVYFRRDLWRLVRALVRRDPRPPDRATAASQEPGAGSRAAGDGERLGEDRRLAGLLAAGTVPVLLVGWLLRDPVATMARNPVLVATASIAFGLLLFAADQWGGRRRGLEAVGLRDALLIGVAQTLALVPGTSRSGITITAGLALHLDREAAARFSFLLAVPVSAAAALHESLSLWGASPDGRMLLQLLLVLAVSAASGLAVIHLFLAFVRRQSLTVFVVYRVVLGVVILMVT